MLAPPYDQNQLEQLITSLADRGFAVAENFVAPALVDRLIADCMAHEERGQMALAGVGRDEANTLAERIRQVKSVWLDGASDGEAAFLALAEHIRSAMNQRLYLGLFEFESQFLTYPPGGFYKRHIDSLQGTRNRIVSLVHYLNRDWQPGDGGELDIWTSRDDQGAPAATVTPRAGTLVLMLSEEIPHAVRAANKTRRVIAGWFRLNASTARRIDPAS